jgi:enterochelin esterase-like enzyme
MPGIQDIRRRIKSVKNPRRVIVSLLCGFLFHAVPAPAQEIHYARIPADPARAPVPVERRGEIIKREFAASSIYPGTRRNYYIYIPKIYSPEKPACLFVCCDGGRFKAAPDVLDNLIARGDMPVTIGVFIEPGVIYDSENKIIHWMRQYEYDTTDDTFARFLAEELLPDAEKQTASDGRPVRLSRDPNDRAIAGYSSGGICAFNAAWQRPDMFSRVLSGGGTFLALHGGNEFPFLIRKTEPKPIRVFLDTGKTEVPLPPIGVHLEANTAMESALRYAGYEVDYYWHPRAHSAERVRETLPDILRWLWKGWPARVASGPTNNHVLKEILGKNSSWVPLPLPFSPEGTLLSNADGDVFAGTGAGDVYMIRDALAEKILRLDPGEKPLACLGRKIYTADAGGTIAIRDGGGRQILARDLAGTGGMVISGDGSLCIAQRLPDGDGALWFIDKTGRKTLVDKMPRGGLQLAMSPNRRLLARTEEHSHWLHFYTINADGMPANRSRFCWLHNTDNADFGGKGGLAFDAGGRLYAATGAGIQVSETNKPVSGIVLAILVPPEGKPSAVCFGGKNRDTLFALSGGRLWQRKMNQ